jgi:hypothetical protein
MKQNRHNLKRYAICALTCLVVIEIFIVPFDCGRYSETFDEYGLIGFLCLPSVLVFQVGYFISIIILLIAAIQASLFGKPRVITWLLGLSVALYSLSLWAIHLGSQYGEFGIGAGFVFGAFGFLPGAVFIYFAMPVIILWAIRKQSSLALN